MQITGLVLNNHKVSLKILPFEINIGEWSLLRDKSDLLRLFFNKHERNVSLETRNYRSAIKNYRYSIWIWSNSIENIYNSKWNYSSAQYLRSQKILALEMMLNTLFQIRMIFRNQTGFGKRSANNPRK